MQQVNLFDELIRMRDAERERIKNATMVAEGKSIPKEINPMGIVQWYTHPMLDEPAMKVIIYFLQEIPPGSRSGRQRHQGGRIHYVWEGEGYTVVDGVAHEWEAGDLIMIPVLPDGCTFQHFNTGESPAKLLTAEANLYAAMGVDLGSGFEVLEPAPEYRGPWPHRVE